jgi:hypothetical protein
MVYSTSSVSSGHDVTVYPSLSQSPAPSANPIINTTAIANGAPPVSPPQPRYAPTSVDRGVRAEQVMSLNSNAASGFGDRPHLTQLANRLEPDPQGPAPTSFATSPSGSTNSGSGNTPNFQYSFYPVGTNPPTLRFSRASPFTDNGTSSSATRRLSLTPMQRDANTASQSTPAQLQPSPVSSSSRGGSSATSHRQHRDTQPTQPITRFSASDQGK